MFAYKEGTITVRTSGMTTKVVYTASLLLLAGMFAFCIFYLVSGHEALKQWYLSLNGCFYNVEKWDSTFFTPATKQAGNRYAGIGAVLSIAGAYAIIRKWRHTGEHANAYNITLTELAWYTAVAVFGIAASLWQWQMMAPAYDEIFSAVNCAELHPLQTWSYYMLPNNHILFNLVNGTLFGWYGHLVGTGRLLSMAAYAGTLLVAYRWLTANMRSYALAFIAVLPVAFQFVVWGMSAQARGYECQLLCGWVAFTSLLHIMKGDSSRTRMNTIANIAGFALIPSWFYFFTAQLLFAAGTMTTSRTILWRYWKYMTVVLAATFLFYLPAICFSGISSLSGNRYVSAAPEGLSVFIPNLLCLGKNFVSYCYSYLAPEGSLLSYVLFALPLSLLFTKNCKRLAGFYIAMWAAYLLCSVYIKHTPFHRTLIVQFSITMALTVYTFWVLVNYMVSLLHRPKATRVVKVALFVLPVIALATWQIRFNKEKANFDIYSNDVNGLYSMHMETISKIPAGSSIAFSHESFYFYYHCRKLGYKVSRCGAGRQQYYVKRTDEPLLALYANYSLLLQGGEDYEIYQRK